MSSVWCFFFRLPICVCEEFVGTPLHCASVGWLVGWFRLRVSRWRRWWCWWGNIITPLVLDEFTRQQESRSSKLLVSKAATKTQGKRAQDEKGGFADVDKMGKDLRWCGNEIKHSSIHLLCERRKFTAIATQPATGKWHLAWKDFFVCCWCYFHSADLNVGNLDGNCGFTVHETAAIEVFFHLK